MGMEKLDPSGAMCSTPPPQGVALEATLDHYSLIRDRAGDLPAPLYLKESSAAGWLEGPFDIPTRVNNYLLDPSPYDTCFLCAPWSTHLTSSRPGLSACPLTSLCLLALLQSPALPPPPRSAAVLSALCLPNTLYRAPPSTSTPTPRRVFSCMRLMLCFLELSGKGDELVQGFKVFLPGL